MSKERIAVEISADLYRKLKDHVDKSEGEFSSVDEFVEFILSEVLKEEEAAYSREEEEEIKKRLRDLGYI